MNNAAFDLEQEQVELLAAMVDADRSTPRAERSPFFFYQTWGGPGSEFLSHPGFAHADGQTITALRSDLLALAESGLLRISPPQSGVTPIDITPSGFRFHAVSLRNITDAVRHTEEMPVQHLNTESFQNRYPDAFSKWSFAQQLLFAEDAHNHLTRIGHDCTEAIQAFATTLVATHQPPGADPNPAAYIRRLDSVIDLHKATAGERRWELLHALVGYWVAASKVAERQEHGADKTGDPVTWEDARRVVFHTAIVMFEIDRTLS